MEPGEDADQAGEWSGEPWNCQKCYTLKNEEQACRKCGLKFNEPPNYPKKKLTQEEKTQKEAKAAARIEEIEKRMAEEAANKTFEEAARKEYLDLVSVTDRPTIMRHKRMDGVDSWVDRLKIAKELLIEIHKQMTLKISTLGGKEHQVKAELGWSVDKLTSELFAVMGMAESATEITILVLTFGEVELRRSALLAEYGLCEGSELSVLTKKMPRPPPRDHSEEEDDIGTFESQTCGKPGADWLHHCAPLPLPMEVHDLIALLAGRTAAQYKEFSLGLEGLDKVRSYVDDLYQDEVSKKSNVFFDQTDFKIKLSSQKLISLVGSIQYINMVAVFGNEPDEILVRRCEAHGSCINFHVDHSKRVMQVALNSDEEYRGGRLVFATQAGLEIPKRNVGAITLHHNDIVHGVTILEEGVRYGLFFLDKATQKL